MNTKLYIAIFMALLLVPLFAQADITVSKHENLFSAYPVEPVFQVCEGSSRTNLIKVSNDGEFTDSYVVTLNVGEEISDWIQLSQARFSLNPQQKEDYLMFFNIPFDTKGEYPFTVVIQSDLGRDEFLDQILKVEKCQNIKLTVVAQEEPILPCMPVFYKIIVENVADFGDNYKLDFGKYNEFYVSEQDKEFYLAPGEVKIIDAVFIRSCDVCKEQEVPVSVKTLDNQLMASMTDTYEILCQYSYNADLEQSHTVCADVETVMPFTITNYMHFGNSYNVDTSMPSFVTMFMDGQAQEKSFVVDLQTEPQKELALVAHPSLDNVGMHTIGIKTESVLGNLKKQYSTDVQVEACYDFSLGSTLTQSDVQDTVCAGKYVYMFNVENTGTRPQEYIVELHGPQWMKLGYNEFMLYPGQNQNIEVFMDTPFDDTQAQAMLYVYNKNYPNIVRQAKIDLSVVSSHKCHLPVIDESLVKMLYDTKVVPLIITNTGLKETFYTINYDQRFTDMSEQSIRLGPGESGIVHVVAKDNVFEHVEGRYPALVSMQVVAPNDEYADGIVYQLPIKIDLEHKSWIVQMYEKIVYDVDYESMSFCQWMGVILLLLAILVFILMIATRLGKIPGLAMFASSAVVVILVIIAILLLVVISVSIGVPDKNYEWEPIGSDYEGLYHEWGQNTNFVIDISKYFVDPDGDTLRYTSSQPTDISVKIEDNLAIFKPDNNFMGKNQIVFTAYDDKGGITDSDIIDLFVVPSQKLSFLGVWNLWCKQINIWLLIFILVCILLMRHKNAHNKQEDDDDDFDFSDIEDEELDDADNEYESIFNEEEEKPSLKKENGLFVYKPKKKPEVEIVDLPKEGIFVVSVNGEKVHQTDCMVVKRIPDELREYYKTLEEAKLQGYKPCGVCLRDEE